MRLLKLLLIILVCAAEPAAAGPYEDAKAASEKGDYVTALRLWRALAAQGDARAQVRLGLMYEFASGVPQDFAAAVAWYRKAADQGDADGQKRLAKMYFWGHGVPHDYAAEAFWYRKAAERGDAEAQYRLGQKYRTGMGMPQDHAAAVSWYRKAAEQGWPIAQYDLGVMYATGEGVPRDYAAAAVWYRKAAEQGLLFAQDALGDMYFNGRGVPQDYASAAVWYRKAAKYGLNAPYKLGLMYFNGHGVPQDDSIAVSWWQEAANKGNVEAQVSLGSMYHDARGVPKDDTIAASWWAKAAAQGNSAAERHLKALAAKAPPAAAKSNADRSTQSKTAASLIQMKKEGGTYVVPVLINNAITLDFIVDSGASDVSVPEDVVSTLIRTGTIRDTDFIGESTYVLADGSRVKSKTFRIRSLKVGDRVLENVTGSVASTKGSLLLGQSFLGRFKSWSIENSSHELVLSDDPPALALPSPGTIIPIPAPSAVAPESADQLYDEAIKKLQEGDYAAAGGGFLTFIQRYPRNKLAGNAQYWLGESYYARRDYNSALTAFAEGDKVYKTSPKGADNLLKLGITLAVLGRQRDACAAFARFGQDYPRATDLQKARIEQERLKNGCK